MKKNIEDHPLWDKLPERAREALKAGKIPVPHCFYCKTPWDGAACLLALGSSINGHEIVPMYLEQIRFCDECLKVMNRGFTLFEVDSKPAFDGQMPATSRGAIELKREGQFKMEPADVPESIYPTGFWVTLDKNDARLMLALTDDQLDPPRAFVQLGQLARLGIDRKHHGGFIGIEAPGSRAGDKPN